MQLELQANDEILHMKFLSLTYRRDVSNMLEIDYKTLIYLLYLNKNNYKEFFLKKKNGGMRVIHAPKKNVKILQRKLNHVLSLEYAPKNFVTGFCKGKSIKDNALHHVRGKVILNLDIKDFFTSINFGRVRGFFLKRYKFSPEVATVLAQLCCCKDAQGNTYLPQGAPTSPLVSNMICSRLDNQLMNLAKNYKCVYTRYADDITLSSLKGSFSNKIVKVDNTNGGFQIELGEDLRKIIETNGFVINNEKVRLRNFNKRQEVTGLVVNEKVNVKRKFIRQVRAMLHDWEKNELQAAQKRHFESFCTKLISVGTTPSFSQIVKGKIDFIKMVRGERDYIYLKLLNKYNRLMQNGLPVYPENIYEEIRKSLWLIKNNSGFEGTGFMLKDYGIVTCNHVIKDKTKITVSQDNDFLKDFQVEIVYSNSDVDLAVLRVKDYENNHFLEFSNDILGVGKRVTVFGYPQYRLGDIPNMVDGKITTKRTDGTFRFIFDKVLLSGNSGGPVLDDNNKVIGVATTGAPNSDKAKGIVDYGIVPISFIKDLSLTEN
jgi:RNA-directed DNA polymerase